MALLAADERDSYLWQWLLAALFVLATTGPCHAAAGPDLEDRLIAFLKVAESPCVK